MKDRQRFFRSCRSINFPFTRPRFLAEEMVAVVAAALEVEDGCVPGVAVIGKEFSRGVVRPHQHIGLVRRSLGGNMVIKFFMPAQTEWRGVCTLPVAAHSVGYGGVGKKGKLVKIVWKCNEYRGGILGKF